jgi:hypothetical protein
MFGLKAKRIKELEQTVDTLIHDDKRYVYLCGSCGKEVYDGYQIGIYGECETCQEIRERRNQAATIKEIQDEYLKRRIGPQDALKTCLEDARKWALWQRAMFIMPWIDIDRNVAESVDDDGKTLDGVNAILEYVKKIKESHD